MTGHRRGIANRCGRVAGVLLAAALGAAHADEFSRVDTGLVFDNNVTGAKLDSDIQSDTALTLNGTIGTQIDLDAVGTLELAGDLKLAAHSPFPGLDEVDLGGHATLQRKLGLGLSAPTVSVSAALLHGSFQDGVRDGWQSVYSVGISQRLSSVLQWHLDAGLQYRTQDHALTAFPDFSGEAFRQFDQVQSVGAIWTVTDKVSLLGTYQHRTGDNTLSIHNGPDADFGDALAISPDAAFGPNYFAERVKAETQSALLGLNYGLSAHASATVMVRYDFTQEPSGDIYRRTITSFVYSYVF